LLKAIVLTATLVFQEDLQERKYRS